MATTKPLVVLRVAACSPTVVGRSPHVRWLGPPHACRPAGRSVPGHELTCSSHKSWAQLVRFASPEPHSIDEMALPVGALACHSAVHSAVHAAVHAASGPCKAGRICISR